MSVHELIVVDAGEPSDLQSQLQLSLQDTEIELQYKDVFKIDKKWIVDLFEKYDK